MVQVLSAVARPARGGGGASLGLVYFLCYSVLGITLPFLPQHLASYGLSAAQAGQLLACYPLMTALAPPAWGWLADRTRRGARLLTLALLGCALAFVPLLFAQTRATILPWLALAAFFFAPVGMLVDSLNLEQVHLRGGHFARRRLWGSVGFIVAVSGFSLFYAGARAEPPPVIVAALTTAALACAASLTLARAPSAAHAPAHLSEAVGLLKDGRIRLLIAIAFLHWMANAPYNTRFTVYLSQLGLPSWVAGLGMSVGVVAEIVVMALYPSIAARVTPSRLLAVAIGSSALRWALVGACTAAVPLVLLQLLHGLTFGGFLVAAIGYLTAVVPPRLRATGQALFASCAFGLSGVVGYLTAGHLFDRWPARDIFFAAGLLELVPAGLALFLPCPDVPSRAAASTSAPPLDPAPPTT